MHMEELLASEKCSALCHIKVNFLKLSSSTPANAGVELDSFKSGK